MVVIPNSAGAVPLQTNMADAKGGVKKAIWRLTHINRHQLRVQRKYHLMMEMVALNKKE